MGTITINYPCGNQSFSRGYCYGFQLHFGCFDTRLEGQVLRFNTGVGAEWYFPVTDVFFTPSTNSYTLDRVFDLENCFLYVFGVPSFAFVNCGIVVSPSDYQYRVGLNCGVAQDINQRADLAVAPYVWRP